jgi:hypothetical protein
VIQCHKHKQPIEEETMTENQTPPKPTKTDLAHTATRAGIGSIPVFGNAAAELFNQVVAPPIERRLHEWRESVGEQLKALEDAGFVTVASLQESDEFVSVVVKASQIAVTTHNDAKRNALRNAILNTALGIEPDESMRQMFLRFIDELTGWHVRILHLFQDARDWYQKQNRQPPQYMIAGSLSQMITDAYPELKGQRELLELIHKDLGARGLTATGNFHTNMSGSGVYEKRTTDFGDRFLRLISKPNVG